MTAGLSRNDQLLLDGIARADVMDAAGRLIVNPYRAMVSLAERVAMAIAIEQLQAIAIEAELLVNALDLPESGVEAAMAVKDHAVQSQIDAVRAALAVARGEPNTHKQETDHG